jgi:hypothetical protein
MQSQRKTNKTTLRSEWRGVQKKVFKKEKQALTQPALLEMDDFQSKPEEGNWRGMATARY